MFRALPAWMGDINQCLSAPYAGVIVTLVTVLCGAAVGMERGKREKPAGLRTMMLICLGASIFTQAGHLLAGPATDHARMSAQVVSGVGFLGAGAIIQSRGLVTGFTTAAAIWVVAAIGVVVGSGYVIAGSFLTLVVLVTLATERWIESLVSSPCLWRRVRIEYDEDHGKTRPLIQEILDDHQINDDQVGHEPPREGPAFVTVRYCHRHRQHRAFLADLVRLPAIRQVLEA